MNKSVEFTRSLIGGLVLSAILLLAASYYWPFQESYYPLNTAWNGCSEIVNVPKTTLLFSYSRNVLNSSSLLAVIGPSIEFTAQEAEFVHDYLENGGNVLLADDFGSGNSLLSLLNIGVRFSGKPLSDLYYYDTNRNFPLIGDFSPNPITRNLSLVILNRPSFIETTNATQVTNLALSSPFSFIDSSGENRPLPNETVNSYTVMVDVKIGRGNLFIISDPSVFINQMINLYDNMRLFENFLSLGDGALIFDVEHLARAPFTDVRAELRTGVDMGLATILLERYLYVELGLVAVILVGFSLQAIRIRRARRRST